MRACACVPDGRVFVFGGEVCYADAFVTLFAHQAVGVEVGRAGVSRHQLYHHAGGALVVTHLQHTHGEEVRVPSHGLSPHIRSNAVLDLRSTRGQKVNPAWAREAPLPVGLAQSVHLGSAYLRGVSVWGL